MKKSMRGAIIAASTPAIVGVMLLLVSLWNIRRFEADQTSVSSMLAIEPPIFMLGFLVPLGILSAACYWLVKRQWRPAIIAVLSVLLFFICFSIAGANGAAFLDAT